MVASSVENPQAFAEDLTGRPITVCPEFPEKYDCRMEKFLICPAVPEQYECRNKTYLLLEAVDKLPDGLTGDNAIRLYVPKRASRAEKFGREQGLYTQSDFG